MSGTGVDEVFDVSPHAQALSYRLLDEPDSFTLPRKLKIAFSASDADRSGSRFSDIGFLARDREGARGFAVFAGGGMGSRPRVASLLFAFIGESEIWVTAEAIKRVFDAQGDRTDKHRNRLRFLTQTLGFERFRELVEQEIARLKRRTDWPLSLEGIRLTETIPRSGDREHRLERAQGDEFGHEPNVTSSEFNQFRKRYVLREEGSDEAYCAKLPLPQGDLHHEHADAIAEFLAPYGEDVLRAAVNQNLYARHLPVAALSEIYEHARRAGALVDTAPLISELVTCTGAATCRLGITLSRSVANATVEHLEQAGIDLDDHSDLRLKFSGCPNSCGRHWVADLGFFGAAGRLGNRLYPTYKVVAGAGPAEFAREMGEVPARSVPEFVAAVLQARRSSSIRSDSFGDWVRAGGKAELKRLVEQFDTVSAFEADSTSYYDWGATEIFSLAGRRAGECSAGMYDLIEADKRELLGLRNRQLTDETARALVSAAARMLLITRGESARDDSGAKQAFRRHFIETGLIDATYAELLEREITAADAARARELADAVVALYRRMDHTLSFR